ncbi:hypothetical protein KDL29_12320 [bacterium]|nr:hypothetical protein [bacterium]
MIRFSIVSNPPLDPAIALCDYEDIQFVEVVVEGPDMRAVLNSAPVKQLDPYPLRNDPSYLARRYQ